MDLAIPGRLENIYRRVSIVMDMGIGICMAIHAMVRTSPITVIPVMMLMRIVMMKIHVAHVNVVILVMIAYKRLLHWNSMGPFRRHEKCCMANGPMTL